MLYSLFVITIFHRANFEHKVHLLKAEASRVALTLNSDAIFSSKISSTSPSSSPRNSEYNIAQGFEDTIELYESAIKGAKQHGFKQYEALGKKTPSCSPTSLLMFSFYLFLFIIFFVCLSSRIGVVWKVLADFKNRSAPHSSPVPHRRHSSIRAVGRDREGAAPERRVCTPHSE